MHKIQQNLLKLTKEFGVQRPKITFLPTFIIELKAKFQLEFNEHKVANIFASKFMDLLKSINGPQFKNRCSASSFLHYAYFVYYGLSFLLTLTKTEQLEPGQGYISSSNSISGPKLKGFLGICLLFIKCIQLHIFVMCYLAMLQQVRLYNVQGWLVKSKMYRI